MQSNLLPRRLVRSKHSWGMFCETAQISIFTTPFIQKFCVFFINVFRKCVFSQGFFHYTMYKSPNYAKVGQKQMLADPVISHIFVVNVTM